MMKHLKYLKKYDAFFEDDNTSSQIDNTAVNNDSTPANKQVDDESAKSLEDNIAEYKSKKTLIDTAYTTITDNNDLTTKVENILGKDVKSRNPFLGEYIKIAEFKRKITKATEKLTTDKEKINDFTEQKNMMGGEESKASIDTEIAKMKDDMNTTNTLIVSLNSDLTKAQADFDKRMKDMEDNIKNNK